MNIQHSDLSIDRHCSKRTAQNSPLDHFLHCFLSALLLLLELTLTERLPSSNARRRWPRRRRVGRCWPEFHFAGSGAATSLPGDIAARKPTQPIFLRRKPRGHCTSCLPSGEGEWRSRGSQDNRKHRTMYPGKGRKAKWLEW